MAVVAERVTSVLLGDGWHVVLWEKLPDGRRVSTLLLEGEFAVQVRGGRSVAVGAQGPGPSGFRFRGFPESDATRTATIYEGAIANVLAYRYLSEEDADARQKREDEYEGRRSGG